MNYLIAVLSTRLQAEQAYNALQDGGIQAEKITILGKGYQSADEFGLIDPNEQGKKGFRRMSYWLVPFGFAAGYVFNLQTGIEIISSVSPVVNHILGGLFGSVGGLMGAYFIGGGVGLSIGSGDALPYRNRLDAGKYLIVVQGSEAVKSLATRVLRQFEPENIQGYVEQSS
ncbi:MAG: hypothetical protein SAJ37_02270 [Oscillatoria sp. PMC 1068.18]|nr:hypothetical protein [Oscillatoria sp. PMC 1076.18]MEC4987549.1 hypothetical protein [Oscillatoria sp. PMC 1068.18]